MRIGVDGGCWTNRRGFERFLKEVLKALGRVGPHHEYVVFLDPEGFSEFHLEGPYVPIRVDTTEVIIRAAAAEGRRSVADLLRMGWAVARQRLDAFFFPTVYSYFPLWKRQPVVVGIHDAIPDRNPQSAFAGRRQERLWRAKMRLAIAQADRILTVSDYSRRSLSQVLGIPDSKIDVISEGVSPQFRRIMPAGEREPLVLFVGGLNPHKNVPVLVRAFARLRETRHGLKLVLAGGHAGDRFKGARGEIRELVQRLRLEDAVVFAGYMPDEELCRLYNRAALFASVSLDEGFGLPALEAMACGTPVVVSSGNAMEEIVGGAGLVVDPHDEAALAGAMAQILDNPALASDLSDKGLRRAVAFSWDESARRLLRILKKLWRAA